MPEPALTGACGCGAVKFEIDEPLAGAAYCHCTRCQRRSGTAYQASAKVAPGSLRIVAGEDRVKGWTPEGGLEKLFCSDCGSALFGRTPGEQEMEIVRLGVIDGDPGIRPQAHQFVAYAPPWSEVPDDGLPRFDERLPG